MDARRRGGRVGLRLGEPQGAAGGVAQMQLLRRVTHPHQAAQPRLQQQIVQRLMQHILGPRLQRRQPQGAVRLRRDDQHRRRRGLPRLPRLSGDPAAQIQTVAIGQGCAEQHQIGRVAVDHLQRLGPVAGLKHVIKGRRQPDPQQDPVG